MAAGRPPGVDLGNLTSHPIRVKYHNADTCLQACFRRQVFYPYLLRSVAGKRHAMPSTVTSQLFSLLVSPARSWKVAGQADAGSQRIELCRLQFSPLVADHDKRVALDTRNSRPLPASSPVSRAVVSGERRGKFIARALVYLH
jgi:hypothetical protein